MTGVRSKLTSVFSCLKVQIGVDLAGACEVTGQVPAGVI